MFNSGYRLFRIYGYPGFGLLLYLIMNLINPYERTFQSWKLFSKLDFAIDGLVNLAYAAVLFETGIQLTLKLNNRLPWEQNFKTRFIVQFLLHITIIIIAFILFFELQFPAKFAYDQLVFRQAIIIGSIFSLLITTVFATEHFFYKWNDTRLEMSEVKKHSIQAQLDALKLQLDPHFIFNNLSALTSLIEENQSLAVTYVINLSSIYRYMLANKSQNIIPVEAELEFIKAYSFLYQIRYGESIRVNINADNYVQGHQKQQNNHDQAGNYQTSQYQGIAPLTLQLLVENAIKHNLFSIESPLSINIYFEDGWIIVKNNKTPKLSKEPGASIGLKNIQQRYLLLGDKEPVFNSLEDSFEVKIPLLINCKS